MPLTPKQKAFLDFIHSFHLEHGLAPSQIEIAHHFGFKSLGTVQDYLTRLKKEGFLQNTPHARRALMPVSTSRSTSSFKSGRLGSGLGVFSLPLLGRVAAGYPIEAIETQRQIEVPASLIKRGEFFVLEVMGNSMLEDGILHGDFVIIKKQKTAEKGQMIVALVNDAATIKRFYPKKEWIELHPAHPDYRPIIVSTKDTFQIEGIVTGVIRKTA